MAHASRLRAVLDEKERSLTRLHEVAEFELAPAAAVHHRLCVKVQRAGKDGAFLIVGRLTTKDLPFREVVLQGRNGVNGILCPFAKLGDHFVPKAA